MLKHQHRRNQAVRLTLPDGTNGLIVTDRRCTISYDFPVEIKIEPVGHNQKTETDSLPFARKTD
ncbi:hypothetical protein [Xenorhabdus bovienii]|uniref:hypothetical protein n=1 Tax=Xenorhabdus bovienii TaxID=40576 RepID=UPI0023B2EB8E|nr:hypothetical protein [Xenorhabdus bovienii]MDE9429057.1 hypothetical protein [Xenorhabdus bovienii]